MTSETIMQVLMVYPDARCIFCEKSDVWCVVETHLGGTIGEGDTQPEAWDDAASRLTETKLPSSPAGEMGSEPKCTCQTDGSAFCKFPHPCRRCHVYHPGVSCYWHAHGKTAKDKPAPGRTFMRSDGSLGCDECCSGDRCDDKTHRDRQNCPYCLGSGTPAAPAPEGDISGPKGSGGAVPKPVPPAGAADDAEVMRLWRQAELPEYFLGNGGTNHKLVKFAALIAAPIAPAAQELVEELRVALAWALPLARLAMEQHRQVRLKAGHDDIGEGRERNKTEPLLGLWDNEIASIDQANAALARAERKEGEAKHV